jgi:hypothetical protein
MPEPWMDQTDLLNASSYRGLAGSELCRPREARLHVPQVHVGSPRYYLLAFTSTDSVFLAYEG